MGDWNAVVGESKEAVFVGYRETVGLKMKTLP